MAKIKWSHSSRRGLQEVHDSISPTSLNYADAQVLKIMERTDILLSHPRSGRIVPEFETETVREVFSGNYRIIYSIDNLPDVTILRVIHFARLLKL